MISKDAGNGRTWMFKCNLIG